MGVIDPGETEDRAEWFRPTSGRVPGVLSLLLVGAIVGVAVLDRDQAPPLPVVAGSLVVGVLVWAAMLRPRVSVAHESLVLRNMLETVTIPLAAVEQVVVRQVLAVGVGGRRFVSSAIGRSWRQSIKAGRPPRPGAAEHPTEQSYPDFVQERLSRLAEDARARAGVRLLSDEQLALAGGVRRAPAWPEIVALVAACAFFVVSLLV